MHEGAESEKLACATYRCGRRLDGGSRRAAAELTVLTTTWLYLHRNSGRCGRCPPAGLPSRAKHPAPFRLCDTKCSPLQQLQENLRYSRLRCLGGWTLSPRAPRTPSPRHCAPPRQREDAVVRALPVRRYGLRPHSGWLRKTGPHRAGSAVANVCSFTTAPAFAAGPLRPGNRRPAKHSIFSTDILWDGITQPFLLPYRNSPSPATISAEVPLATVVRCRNAWQRTSELCRCESPES